VNRLQLKNYAFTYELFQRWFPEISEQARSIKRGEARRVLVQRYLDNVVAADRKMIAKVFHVFHWTKRELDRTIATLIEEDTVREMGIGEIPHLVSVRWVVLVHKPGLTLCRLGVIILIDKYFH
jgi:hypothetical protein